MKLEFLGAAGTVTGSKFLVEAGDTRLLVDCGLFQGVKALRRRNWRPLPFGPAGLDAVALTHAHLDHSGHLPALVRDGFAGEVLATAPTCALCRILLPDSGHIQEEDAEYATRKRFSKHAPALPLYTEADAERALEHLRPVEPGAPVRVGALEVSFQPAGHILGATSVRVSDGRTQVLFSGDLGRADDLLMRPPAPPDGADVVVMESTYGDRLHGDEDPVEAIGSVVSRVRRRGGVVLMPSFAVGRAQALLLCLHRYFEKHPEERVPVYVNSPMATDVTALYRRFTDWHRLSAEHCAEVCDVAHYVRSVDESRELNERRGPLVIVSASGMATGGRVLHHLRALAPDPRNAILLPGFQAPGTRGAAIAAGAEAVKIHGRYVPIRAEVAQLDLLSAHADRDGLVDWLESARQRPRRVFLVHGEPVSADVLRRTLHERLGVGAEVAEDGQSVDLGA